jgi:hypothetical protein
VATRWIGTRAADRLRLLARVKWPTTQLLRRCGLQAGMRCLDVGLGLIYHRLIVPVTGVVRYAKALDRSVTCSMNELVKDRHAGIHDLIPDEKELAGKYNTKELLLEHEPLKRHIAWARKQK